jgi:CubicO group peptidase (beta-lactamase class C family)
MDYRSASRAIDITWLPGPGIPTKTQVVARSVTIMFLVAVLVVPSTVLSAQSPDSIAMRRQAVESSLLPPIISPGEEGYALRDRMTEHRVPGVSIAVINDGEVEWAAGYGVKRLWSTDSVDAATLFQAASVSKSLTAVAVVQFVEEGLLDLDQDVANYLSSWTLPEGAQTAEERVTLRRLLSHTAGVNVHGFGGVPKGRGLATSAEVLEGRSRTDPIRVESEPGSRFRYSGGGYQIVQMLLEDVTGEQFGQLMRHRVLDELDMDQSTFEQPLPDDLVPQAAAGHQRSADRFLDTIPGGWYDHPAQAAAGLWTTPADLARFALGIRDAWAGESEAIVSQESAQAMLTGVENGWGLGMPVSGTGRSLSFGHGGNSPGYAAFWVLYPESGDGAVVMANARSSGKLIMEVVRAVERVYGWPGEFAPRENLPFGEWMGRMLLRLAILMMAVVGVWFWYTRRSPATQSDDLSAA